MRSPGGTGQACMGRPSYMPLPPGALSRDKGVLGARGRQLGAPLERASRSPRFTCARQAPAGVERLGLLAWGQRGRG